VSGASSAVSASSAVTRRRRIGRNLTMALIRSLAGGSSRPF
jgi:hypothetical protein